MRRSREINFPLAELTRIPLHHRSAKFLFHLLRLEVPMRLSCLILLRVPPCPFASPLAPPPLYLWPFTLGTLRAQIPHGSCFRGNPFDDLGSFSLFVEQKRNAESLRIPSFRGFYLSPLFIFKAGPPSTCRKAPFFASQSQLPLPLPSWSFLLGRPNTTPPHHSPPSLVPTLFKPSWLRDSVVHLAFFHRHFLSPPRITLWTPEGKTRKRALIIRPVLEELARFTDLDP